MSGERKRGHLYPDGTFLLPLLPPPLYPPPPLPLSPFPSSHWIQSVSREHLLPCKPRRAHRPGRHTGKYLRIFNSSLSLSLTHTQIHAHTCARMHTRTHTHTHTCTHTHTHKSHTHTQITHTQKKAKKQSVPLPLSGHAIRQGRNACALSGPMSQCNATSWSRARNSQVD